jgi:LytS/YehU family sensor histidine kinase
MLRHTVDESIDQPVSLYKEIEYISNFISLHKQLNKKIQINFSVEGDITHREIIPRILITFIENAFKHGDIYCVKTPITFKVESSTNFICFSVNNKKKKGNDKKLHSIGLGLAFVKQQLESFYKNKYDLKIDDMPEDYSCRLLINI